jgi:hypothetical protein
MNILVALRHEERRLEKQGNKVQAALAGIRAATQALSGRNSTQPRSKRHLSAAARARISRAQKARWAKVKSAK